MVAWLALAAFVPLTFVAFASLGARRGVLMALLGGWLLLPWFDDVLRLPILSSKRIFVPAVVFGVSLLVDGGRWRRLKPGWLDLPVLVWCAAQAAASLSNELGAYDAFQASTEAFLTWGVPYLLGRAYLGDAAGVRDFAVGLVLAALAYVPLCLWEIRMSPQLHRAVYGFSTIVNFGQAMRFGGYRPNVFLSHGLMLGLFMACSTLVAWWLWRTRAVPRLRGLPLGWLVLVLLATTVLCKSTGAIILLAVGIGALEATRLPGASLLLAAFLALAPAFAAVRISGWTGRDVVALAERYVNADRAASLAYRLEQENHLIAKAMKKPLNGWGRFGRSRVYDEDGKDVSVTDSLYVIVLGISGTVGLASLGALLLLPGLALLRRFPARRWRDPRVAPAAALAVTSALVALDSLLNAMTSPLVIAGSGAVASFCHARLQGRAPRRPATRPAPRRRPEDEEEIEVDLELTDEQAPLPATPPAIVTPSPPPPPKRLEGHDD